MNKEDIEIADKLYYNTTGAYGVPISQRCTVMDIGQVSIWVIINGNLGPTPVQPNKLSKKPLNMVTNGKW